MASQWMSRSIPEYNKIVSPLQDIFELAMKNQPKRTKSVARGVKLKLFGWDVNHTLAVERLKPALANAVQLSYPNEKMLQCVFCDASYNCSSGMVTQIPFEDRDRPIHEQRHEPLGFVGHRFHGSELNWAIVDKEAFAIVDTLRKLSYLLHLPHPFRIYTDHRNLISMYNPKKCSKQSAERLMRWGIELRDFNFAIHHISGEDNVWADLLSRWGSVTEEAPTNFGVRAVTLAPESQPAIPFQMKMHWHNIGFNHWRLKNSFGQTLLRLRMSSASICLSMDRPQMTMACSLTNAKTCGYPCRERAASTSAVCDSACRIK